MSEDTPKTHIVNRDDFELAIAENLHIDFNGFKESMGERGYIPLEDGSVLMFEKKGRPDIRWRKFPEQEPDILEDWDCARVLVWHRNLMVDACFYDGTNGTPRGFYMTPPRGIDSLPLLEGVTYWAEFIAPPQDEGDGE